MFTLSPVALGIVLLVLGFGFVALTLILLRLIPSPQPLANVAIHPISGKKDHTSPNITPHTEAVLLMQTGGRVAYLNQHARELFNVWEEEPNLESLARRTRPSESFLMLCAGEGQARFSVNGRFVEATSYYAPGSIGKGLEQYSAILVSIRRPQFVLDGGSPLTSHLPSPEDLATPHSGEVSAQALNIFNELSQSMASSLELEVTLQTILESVERLLPSDFFEITVWNEEERHLVPYRLVGLPGIDRRLEKATERYRTDQGYTGYLVASHTPLLVKDISTFRQVRPTLDRQRFPFLSYLGTPLLIAGELIGTLELASLTRENYNESDLEVLRLLSGQAAIALNNALLYQQELSRSVELAGLANLAQTISSVRDPHDLYTRLIENITPLILVEVLGFLVYDENRRVLEAQLPFMGIQPNVVEWYQATIPPGSPAENVWQEMKMIVAANAVEDPRLQALELHHLAQAAGIRQTVLVPLTSGGRMLGYLQVANKRDGSSFDQNDLRFLAIVASQTAPIIDNATLVQLSRRRAQRAETLRRIASLTGSTATLDEVLKFSLLDLARLLQADAAAVLMLDEERGELRLHRPSVFGIPPETANRFNRFPTDDPDFHLTVTHTRQQFFTGNLEEVGLPGIYGALAGELKIRSAINVPLIMRERGMGELMVGSFRPNFFSPGDLQTVATASSQLAAAIEQSILYSQTDHSLRQRVEQLTALTRISRELNTTTMLGDLLKRVFDEAVRTTRADCGTILLFDLEQADAGSGDIESRIIQGWQPAIQLHLGDDPGAELHPLEKVVLQRGEALIVADFDQAHLPEILTTSNTAGEGHASIDGEPLSMFPSVRGGNGEHWADGSEMDLFPAHEGIRSALVVPIAYQGQVAGLLHLHARSPNHFGRMEREIGEALAVQAAIALGNAQRYDEQRRRSEMLNRRVETLSKLFEVSQVLQAEQPLEQALEAIAYAIQSATPFEKVLINTYDSARDQLVRLVGAGIPLPMMAELRSRPQPWRSIQQLLDPRYRIGRTYFIPQDQTKGFTSEFDFFTLLADNDRVTEANIWKPQDTLIVPLFGTAGEPLGSINVDAPRNNLRPDRATIETLEIFSSQAGLIIESQHKVHDLRGQLVKIEADLEIAHQSAVQAQAHLPSMLHKDIEQTLAIQHLSQRARRITAGLNIAELVSKQPGREEILFTLGQETLARMEFDAVLVAEPAAGGLNLSHSLGTIPPDVNPKALLGQRNPLRQTLQTGELILVSNLSEDDDWQGAPLLRALEARSFLCLPVVNIANGAGPHTSVAERQDDHSDQELMNTVSDEPQVVAALLAVSRSPVAQFTEADVQLFDLMARQVAVALQNLQLLADTSRRLREVNLLLEFSRQLGSLDPASILRALTESSLRAVSGAQSALVALWDPVQGVLVPRFSLGFANNQELLQVLYRPGEGLAGQVFERRSAINLHEVDFARHYNLSTDNLLHYRNATGGRLPVSSVAVPIMTGATGPEDSRSATSRAAIDAARLIPLGVLVLDNSQSSGAFTEGDLAVMASLAQQTALTLENARLYQASERRSEQLQALTRVSTEISSSLQAEDLITALLDQLRTILPYDTGTLWLGDRSRQVRSSSAASGAQNAVTRLVIRSARGFADSEQRLGLTVDVRDSQLMSEMTLTMRPIWVPDVRQDPRFQALSFAQDFDMEGNAPPGLGFEYLCWLGVPLIASGAVIGVIALEKSEPDFYSPDDIQVATAFAGQAAIGLENAALYQESVNRAQELDQRSQTLTILNRLSGELSGSLDADRIIEFAIREFLQVMPCTTASALMFDRALPEPYDEILLQVEFPPPPASLHHRPGSPLTNAALFDHLRETGGIFNTEDVEREPELAPLRDFLAERQTRSLLIVPVISGSSPDVDVEEIAPESRFHGMLLAHNNQPYRFRAEEIELARTISNQLAISLQNARLFEETRDLTEYLELRVQQRTAELAREHQRADTLLRIISELSASLDLDQVLNRTLQVLSEYVDAEQITILIARPGERKLHRLASVGYTPEPEEDGSPTPFDVDQGLAGWVIHQRQSVLVDDVLEDERWIQLPYASQEATHIRQHRSVLGVPLMSGAEALGCLLLFHTDTYHFSMDQLDLVQAAANQVAVAVNNAELYRLIRDQAEDLGGMLRNQQIETSRSKAILEAVADGVLVTDANRIITLFNESAEKILSLERAHLLGKSMEHFSGIFGRATHSWLEKVNSWSQDPGSTQPGELYAEQINLEDGRVISVHLAPVTMRTDFLGTVSIFQDITHQVEVDRLKSEFVATVSHELRTPMTSIKGYVEILLMGAAGQLSDQQKHFLQIVKSNTERLSVLVNDLLDISAIEAGRIVLKLQPLNLEEIANEAIGEMERRTQGDPKEIQIDREFQPGLPRVVGDPERVRRIFDNMLDNAFQYNLPGGRVIVRLKEAKDAVQVDIKDTGVGISREEQERVFERFFRGDSPLALGVAGTGLGLSIVNNLITMQNGRIWVESSGISGQGSTFSFTLPAYHPENQ